VFPFPPLCSQGGNGGERSVLVLGVLPSFPRSGSSGEGVLDDPLGRGGGWVSFPPHNQGKRGDGAFPVARGSVVWLTR